MQVRKTHASSWPNEPFPPPGITGHCQDLGAEHASAFALLDPSPGVFVQSTHRTGVFRSPAVKVNVYLIQTGDVAEMTDTYWRKISSLERNRFADDIHGAWWSTVESKTNEQKLGNAWALLSSHLLWTWITITRRISLRHEWNLASDEWKHKVMLNQGGQIWSIMQNYLDLFKI